MSYLGNKLKEKMRKYLRRKIRINTQVKAQDRDIRVVINRSNKCISAQALDQTGKILASISDKSIAGDTKTQRAENAGEAFAKIIADKKKKIVFDRNGYLYHGRVKAFVDGLRKGGIQI